ncbi:hypothetical protein [Frankia tisae]|uniref:hypothetical protein n=1 Tax=Frankia tisae TaxID=2950104 RepID=UPI0027E34615|nr:hypothetical protein [Frankia tisae]
MAGVQDGIYRITLDGRQVLTGAAADNVVLLPEHAGRQEWQFQQAGSETWVIRRADSSQFLGFDGKPDTFERARTFG